ncbi:MAG: Rieske 2Fe-2S domain-containing protein [Saprospiraceae bacterium]|nr:Rieske 2Fe-2S domain-containing protein [Saprospiraceae bacterium]
MNKSQFFIDPDIRKAFTLPSDVYTSPEIFQRLKDMLFVKSWQLVSGSLMCGNEFNLLPGTFLPDLVDEPLLFVREGEKINCISNVCTHRAKILVETPQLSNVIRCGYHGRCFRTDGTFKSMPEFDDALNFPDPSDNLKHFDMQKFGCFHFVSLFPHVDLEKILEPVTRHLSKFRYDQLEFRPELSATYLVNANWLAYCDNYLEGFHIPFVHKTLNEKVEYTNYEIRTFEYCNVQIARAKEGEPSIELSQEDPDFGENIYAYYWFIYPNLMLNFYAWGISVNIVQPVGQDKTRIIFETYLFRDLESQKFADTALHLTEMEDEAVVESVQLGLKSMTYNRGRFSPTREQAVHAFHLYLSGIL